jgi:DNA modification methylase
MSYSTGTNKFANAVGRWAGIGPYYAMFPIDFAFDVVNSYSEEGDAVFDPFAGRSSSIYAAAALGRSGVGIEISPVGWLYGHVKMAPASRTNVLNRAKGLAGAAKAIPAQQLEELPEFFHICYSKPVLRYLVAAREKLAWRSSRVDAAVMAMLLVYLHGKKQDSLSNQMRQGKAMAPDYSIRWWRDNDSEPPNIDPIAFLEKKIEWRYKKGKPRFEDSLVKLGDCTKQIKKVKAAIRKQRLQPFDLLFTSPPYCGVTNYHYDQWLRLWMLGYSCRPTAYQDTSKGRFGSQASYISLLNTVFTHSAELMKEDAVIYVRTDARPFTFETTLSSLKASFPRKTFEIIERPFQKNTQTALYGDNAKKPGEIDIVGR